MSKDNLICVVDTGTSSMRTVLYRSTGERLFFRQNTYDLKYLADGGVEQAPEDLLECLYQLLETANKFCCNNNYKIKAVSLTSQRSSVLPIDENGMPLRNILMWQDRRAESICRAIDEKKEIYGICGMMPTVTYSAPKISWLQQNEPAIYARASKLIGIHEYLIYLLTGQLITDYSVASRSCLLDIRSLNWSSRLLDLFSVDRRKLVTLSAPGSICGYITAAAAACSGIEAGTPVITAGGDQQCALIGAGVLKPGTTMINLGTGAYVLTMADNVYADPAYRVNCNASAIPQYWVMESTTPCAGLAYKWLRKVLFPLQDEEKGYEILNALAEACPPGAGGLVMFPSYLSELNKSGSILYPLQLNMGTMHIVRSMVEGIAADIHDCVNDIERIGCVSTRYVCTGGLTACQPLLHIVADMLGKELFVCEDQEATARGALISALLTLGFRNEAYKIAKHTYVNMKIAGMPRTEMGKKYQTLQKKRTMLKKMIQPLYEEENDGC